MRDIWLTFSLHRLVFDLPVLRFFKPSASLLAPEVTRGRVGAPVIIFSGTETETSSLTAKGLEGSVSRIGGGDRGLKLGLIEISLRGTVRAGVRYLIIESVGLIDGDP